MKSFIDKLFYGFQEKPVESFQIFIPLVLIFTIILFVYKSNFQKKGYSSLIKLIVIIFYLFIIIFSLINNNNYVGSDFTGNCSWLFLEDNLENGQNAYDLQANRFIQEEPYIKKINISFYYGPTYKLFYERFCLLESKFFNLINLSGLIIIILLISKLNKKHILNNFLLMFTGLSSSIWMFRQGQVIFLEMFFLIMSLHFIKKQNYFLGILFYILFGLGRIYFLIILVPLVLIFKKIKIYNILLIFLLLFLFQFELWESYINLWFGSDGYLLGDVTKYSSRTSLFDEHLGRYAFSFLLIIRFLFDQFTSITWNANLYPSIFLLIFLIFISNLLLYKFTKKSSNYEKAIYFMMLNFVLYPVLKPYIFFIYFIFCIYLFEFKNDGYERFTYIIFSYFGLAWFLISNLITSTLLSEIYQLIILLIHFSATFLKKFSKLQK